MNIPDNFPADVKAKLKAIDEATGKNNQLSENIKKQLSTEDYERARVATGLQSANNNDMNSNKSKVQNEQNATVATESFFSKNKYYLIGGGVVLIGIVLFFYFRKRGK